MTANQQEDSPGPTVAIHTHGCKLNQSDSQALAREFEESGYRVVATPGQADVVVLNSCTVTATADAKARQFLRATRRANPHAVVVATGCYAQRSPESLEELEAVSLVLGNTEKPRLVNAVTVALEQSYGNGELVGAVSKHAPTDDDNPSTSAKKTGGAGRRNRAMVKIQEGCDQVCAYCIVPKVRGRERSIPPESLVADISRHSNDGHQEVVLTGTQLGTYGFDIPGASLVGLIRRILEETPITRLRVSSLQAQEITSELLDLWRNPRLCPHFHIPLQSGSDNVLRSMRRRYDTRQFSETVSMVRGMVPDAGITTDVIVGYPTEGDGDFEAGYCFAESIAFSDMHVFPYSERPGTSAAHIKDQVSGNAKQKRMARMLTLAADGHHRFREGQLGSIRHVLWEPRRSETPGGDWNGLSDNYIRVRTCSSRDLANTITDARLERIDDDIVLAFIG